MTHPKSLARTYYRGNCERNPELYNSGNYCTNTFELRLQSADGRTVNYQDPLPDLGLSLRFEIVRSPGSTPLLFADDQMNRVFISSEAFGDPAPDDPSTFHLTTVEPGDRWAVEIPLMDDPAQNGRTTRRFYVSFGSPPSGEASGAIHYAFQLEMVVEDGKIAAASDV